ncbi:hypothetical protein MTO96_031381, partial [Rhipicephalus appendiculatus]
MFQAVNLPMGNTESARPTFTVGPAFHHHLVPPDVNPAKDGHATAGEPSECELRVVPAKEWKWGDNVYPMIHSPRGICVIINNYDFGDSKREGSEHDVRRMRYLFEAFHFKCIEHWDLTASEMTKKLQAAASFKEHEVADCLVVVLMSHGAANVIFGVDRKTVHLENEIFSLFNNESCPALQGKPKLFFVQACRI